MDTENKFQKQAVELGLLEDGPISSNRLTEFAFEKGSLLMTPDGDFECGPIRVKDDKYFTLKDMQSAVGGYVDLARLSETGKSTIRSLLTSKVCNLSEEEADKIVNDLELVVNDDGFSMGLKVNPLASLVSEQGYLVGPVVLARRSGWE